MARAEAVYIQASLRSKYTFFAMINEACRLLVDHISTWCNIWSHFTDFFQNTVLWLNFMIAKPGFPKSFV